MLKQLEEIRRVLLDTGHIVLFNESGDRVYDAPLLSDLIHQEFLEKARWSLP
jgi:hypothetical protein